jgi:hypothetical protein
MNPFHQECPSYSDPTETGIQILMIYFPPYLLIFTFILFSVVNLVGDILNTFISRPQSISLLNIVKSLDRKYLYIVPAILLSYPLWALPLSIAFPTFEFFLIGSITILFFFAISIQHYRVSRQRKKLFNFEWCILAISLFSKIALLFCDANILNVISLLSWFIIIPIRLLIEFAIWRGRLYP